VALETKRKKQMIEATTNGQQEKAAARRRPVHEIAVGSVRVAIWMNQTTSGLALFNATFSRSYKDREGNWRDSESFGRDELPLLNRAVELAHDWIYYKQLEADEQ
jgi:hypothetical protein